MSSILFQHQTLHVIKNARGRAEGCGPKAKHRRDKKQTFKQGAYFPNALWGTSIV